MSGGALSSVIGDPFRFCLQLRKADRAAHRTRIRVNAERRDYQQDWCGSQSRPLQQQGNRFIIRMRACALRLRGLGHAGGSGATRRSSRSLSCRTTCDALRREQLRAPAADAAGRPEIRCSQPPPPVA